MMTPRLAGGVGLAAAVALSVAACGKSSSEGTRPAAAGIGGNVGAAGTKASSGAGGTEDDAAGTTGSGGAAAASGGAEGASAGAGNKGGSANRAGAGGSVAGIGGRGSGGNVGHGGRGVAGQGGGRDCSPAQVGPGAVSCCNGVPCRGMCDDNQCVCFNDMGTAIPGGCQADEFCCALTSGKGCFPAANPGACYGGPP